MYGQTVFLNESKGPAVDWFVHNLLCKSSCVFNAITIKLIAKITIKLIAKAMYSSTPIRCI